MNVRFVLPFFVLFLGGCASVGGQADYSGKDVACIRGGMPDGMTLWTEGATHVTIIGVDGIKWNGWQKRWCLQSGIHALSLQGTISLYQETGDIQLDLIANRSYRVRGKKTDAGIVYRLVDETHEPETLAREFTLSRAQTTTLTPTQPLIFIPKR